MTAKVFKFVDEDNEDLSKLQELMIITMEECGELIQECSKSIRMDKYDRTELKEELSDVMCMLELMIENKIITRQELSNGANLKKMKLMKWSKLIK
jgi:NTP pyrophosphatase (non-canonical NTP hydrolase)